jgi:hypothetical protein
MAEAVQCTMPTDGLYSTEACYYALLLRHMIQKSLADARRSQVGHFQLSTCAKQSFGIFVPAPPQLHVLRIGGAAAEQNSRIPRAREMGEGEGSTEEGSTEEGCVVAVAK